MQVVMISLAAWPLLTARRVHSLPGRRGKVWKNKIYIHMHTQEWDCSTKLWPCKARNNLGYFGNFAGYSSEVLLDTMSRILDKIYLTLITHSPCYTDSAFSSIVLVSTWHDTGIGIGYVSNSSFFKSMC